MHDPGLVCRQVKQLGSQDAKFVFPFTVTKVFPIGLIGIMQLVDVVQLAQ